ncbi:MULTISPECIES: transglutaminase-like cysteine peptidase [Sphingobium]|uniref:transglutaminase-like cysteine peptidase n=1 Tax=Sphingobium sp. MI1205 TaxID=407020 RepID=UPI0007703DB6|nr:transglutaminase-like cysteine peptidase [Sphingobium sp. MI1205]AMK18533.1 transglutaminase [Sphingobium sp. MI1205]
MSGFVPSLRSTALRAIPALLLAGSSGHATAQAPLAPSSAPYGGQGRVAYSPADRISANLLAGGMSRLAAISAQQGGTVSSDWAPASPLPTAIVNSRRMGDFMGKLPGWQLQGVQLSVATNGLDYRQPELTPAFMRGFTPAPAPETSAFVMQTRAAQAPLQPAPRLGQPDIFGSVALPIGRTTLDAKWASIVQPLNGRGLWSNMLHAARAAGPQQQVEMINRWVNQRLRFTDDRNGGDSWAPASQSLLRGSGDCEDYAIAKMKLLEAAGFDRRAMFLVIARDLVRQADHAVLAVRIDSALMILDNMTDKVLPSSQVSDYRPIMSFNAYGRWTHGYRVTTPQPVQFAAR